MFATIKTKSTMIAPACSIHMQFFGEGKISAFDLTLIKHQSENK